MSEKIDGIALWRDETLRGLTQRSPLTLTLSHQGRGDYSLPLGIIPSPLAGEG